MAIEVMLYIIKCYRIDWVKMCRQVLTLFCELSPAVLSSPVLFAEEIIVSLKQNEHMPFFTLRLKG